MHGITLCIQKWGWPSLVQMKWMAQETGVTGGALGMAGAAIGIPSGMCRGDALLAAGYGRSSCSTL